MVKQLSKEEEKELSTLYRQAIIIADNFTNIDSNEPEAIVGMNNILSTIKPIVETTYQRKDLSGMKMIINDFKEMFAGSPEEKQQATNQVFRENNLSVW